jgi:hypothetical protein
VQDYAACIWPAEADPEQRHGSLGLAHWADALNEQQPGWAELLGAAAGAGRGSSGGGSGGGGAAPSGSPGAADVITLSHFLPHQDLLPEKRCGWQRWQAAGCARRPSCCRCPCCGCRCRCRCWGCCWRGCRCCRRVSRARLSLFARAHPCAPTGASRAAGAPRPGPRRRFLHYPPLAKAVGSHPLMRRLQALRPLLHVFGHTHLAWDAEVQGGVRLRCIQAPLCYPNERRHRMRWAADPARLQRWGARRAGPLRYRGGWAWIAPGSVAGRGGRCALQRELVQSHLHREVCVLGG